MNVAILMRGRPVLVALFLLISIGQGQDASASSKKAGRHVQAKTSAEMPPEQVNAAEHWLDETPRQQAEEKRRLPYVAGLLILAMSLAAVCLRLFMRRQGLLSGSPLEEQDTLRVLAQRPLGNAQSLILVEVMGERLLLTKNAEETSLLTHLPGSAAESTASEDTVSAQDTSKNENDSFVAATDVAVHPSAAAQAYAPASQIVAQNNETRAAMADENLPLDLRGLRQWQVRATESLGQGG